MPEGLGELLESQPLSQLLDRVNGIGSRAALRNGGQDTRDYRFAASRPDRIGKTRSQHGFRGTPAATRQRSEMT